MSIFTMIIILTIFRMLICFTELGENWYNLSIIRNAMWLCYRFTHITNLQKKCWKWEKFVTFTFVQFGKCNLLNTYNCCRLWPQSRQLSYTHVRCKSKYFEPNLLDRMYEDTKWHVSTRHMIRYGLSQGSIDRFVHWEYAIC